VKVIDVPCPATRVGEEVGIHALNAGRGEARDQRLHRSPRVTVVTNVTHTTNSVRGRVESCGMPLRRASVVTASWVWSSPLHSRLAARPFDVGGARLNSQEARRRADDLQARLQRRLAPTPFDVGCSLRGVTRARNAISWNPGGTPTQL
jgi:hypothetical protein